MSSTKCKAKTRSGTQCNLTADTSGYCHLHDPEKIKSHAEQKKANWDKGNKMREILEVVHRTCSAKGWKSYTSNLDEDNWKYATVSVERYVSSGYSGDTITGIFELTLENGVQISRSGTSFYKYGLQDLYDAIFSDLSKLPWLESPKKKKKHA